MAEFHDKKIKFVVDVNLGKLAHYLLLLGFDTKHSNSLINDAELAEVSSGENRILLTRDRELLKRKKIGRAHV